MRCKYSMNDDLVKYPLYFIAVSGDLMPCNWIQTTGDYDHSKFNIHHYIPKGDYKRDKKWYDERGIKQKLIYMPSWLHLIVHNLPDGGNISDEEFERKYKISRWDLVFNRRYSKY